MTGIPQSDSGLSDMRFLTVAEVAALMRVSKMTVYRLVHAGDLTAVRVGRSFRVPEQAVHEYLREAVPPPEGASRVHGEPGLRESA
jgi:excisionase family DNA binding protein